MSLENAFLNLLNNLAFDDFLRYAPGMMLDPKQKNENFQKAVDTFIEAAGKISANMLGMVNKVGGQIYALLFLSKDPLSLDDIADILKISKSNISINIRDLESNRLVKKVWVKGTRKDYYEAARDYPKHFIKDFFDRIRAGIDDSIRIIYKCRDQFEKVEKEFKDKNEDLEFILHQLSILDLFYHGASKIFDDFYQGKKVDIDLLRKVIFED